MLAESLEMQEDVQMLYNTHEKICQHKLINKNLEIALQEHALDNISPTPIQLWREWHDQLDSFKKSHIVNLPDMKWELRAAQSRNGFIAWSYIVTNPTVSNVQSQIALRHVNLPSRMSPVWEPSFYYGLEKGYFTLLLL